MSDNDFKYYTQEEADKFAFYQIPKELTTNNKYKHISTNAKFLYGLLRDRNQLSVKNNWVDDDGNIYIIFTREEAMEILNVKNDKIISIFKEVKDVYLMKEVRQGLGKPNIIYVGKIVPETIDKSLKSVKPISASRQNRFQQVGKTDASNTNINNTDSNKKTTTVKVEPEVKKVVVVSPFATVSTERVKELQKEIKGIINASISVRAIEAMIAKKGEDQIYLYLQNWDKFQYQDIKNVSRFFENAVLKPYDIPTTSKGKNKVAQETNYKQRSNDDFAEFARLAELAAYK